MRSLIYWTTLISVPLSLTQLLLGYICHLLAYCLYYLCTSRFNFYLFVYVVTHINRSLGIPDELFSLLDNSVLTVLAQVVLYCPLILLY